MEKLEEENKYLSNSNDHYKEALEQANEKIKIQEKRLEELYTLSSEYFKELGLYR